VDEFTPTKEEDWLCFKLVFVGQAQ